MVRFLLFCLLIIASSFCFADPVNINTAGAEELAENLKGVGPKKALAIIQFREENGPFFAPDEITKVKGIGPKTLEKNKENIHVRD